MKSGLYARVPMFGGATMALLTAMAGSAIAAPTAADLAHIQAIETGLLPAMVVKGEASPAMTLPARMAALHVPGVSLAFFEDGKLAWAKAYGLSDVEHNVPVTTDTLFQAGSISKPLAAMAALRLVEAGKLSLDEDVNTRLKSWQVPVSPLTAAQKVTLRRLLTHTAGLTVHGFRGYSRTEARPTLPQVLNGEKPANSAPVTVVATPGSAWSYSGGGYTVAQLMMQDVTGRPFADLVRETVLVPAGLAASTYEQPLPPAREAAAALGYRGDGRIVDGGWHVYPEQAAAGLWTTPSDLARLAIELQNEAVGTSSRILSPAMARTMLTGGMGEWGLGVNVPADGPARFGHGGANEGFRNEFVAFTGGHRQGFVVMTNGDNGSELIAELERAVAAVYGWPIDRPDEVTPVTVGPAVLARDAGVYEIAGVGRLEVSVKDGRLFVATPAMGPAPLEARTSATGFFIQSAGVVGEFSNGPDGAVTGMALKSPFGPFAAKKIS